jgi:hypothetical protein
MEMKSWNLDKFRIYVFSGFYKDGKYSEIIFPAVEAMIFMFYYAAAKRF